MKIESNVLINPWRCFLYILALVKSHKSKRVTTSDAPIPIAIYSSTNLMFMSARLVCSRMGEIIRRDNSEPRVSTIFYRAVFQEVLLFGAETWVLLEVISWELEGVHMGSLNQITG